MSKLAFVDTETTSLHWNRRAWDVAIITYDTSTGQSRSYQQFIRTIDLDMSNANTQSLNIGQFYARHPEMNGKHDGYVTEAVPEVTVMLEVEKLTRNTHIVGAVPNFDTETLAAAMYRHGICPSWHYHLIDVETLAVGSLTTAVGSTVNTSTMELPWDSDKLSEILGIRMLPELRHTAIGDAMWAMAIYAEVMDDERIRNAIRQLLTTNYVHDRRNARQTLLEVQRC